jgi:rod shape-determining protein MreC
LNTKRIGEHRSTIIFVMLVTMSLGLLASGTRAVALHDAIRSGVMTAASPLWWLLRWTEDGATYVAGFVTAYDAAHDRAVQLERELVGHEPALARLTVLQAENQRLRAMIGFERSQPRLTQLPAAVLTRSEGTLIVDRGSVHGVREFMCAMTPDGVVGVVTEVGPFLSTVATLRSATCNIGAMVQRNRVPGTVHGSGSDLSPSCEMQNIDLKDDVRTGDVVVTGGGTCLFPPGYLIGTVTNVGDLALQKSAWVEPAVDPHHVSEVLLVTQAMPTEEALADYPPAPEPIAAIPTMPDNRSMQERYAP